MAQEMIPRTHQSMNYPYYPNVDYQFNPAPTPPTPPGYTPQYAPYSLQTTKTCPGEHLIPVVNWCASTTYLVAGGAGVVALLYLMMKR